MADINKMSKGQSWEDTCSEVTESRDCSYPETEQGYKWALDLTSVVCLPALALFHSDE